MMLKQHQDQQQLPFGATVQKPHSDMQLRHLPAAWHESS
jgi:hypothetical protein